MQKQAELVRGGFAAGRAVSRKMRLPGFDVVFHAATPAVNVFVEHLRPSAGKIGDDEAGIGSVRPGFDTRNDPFHPAPTRGAVIEFLVAAHLGRLGTRIEAGLCAFLQGLNMTAQGCCWRGAQDEIETVRPAEIDDLGAAIMAVAADQDLCRGPIGPDGAEQTAQEGGGFPCRLGAWRGAARRLRTARPRRIPRWLEALLVIMRVEQAELLAAMDSIERVIEIQHDPLGHAGVRRAIEIDERLLHAQSANGYPA